MPPPSRRDALLDAAVQVIRRDGASALTLDAVASAAGVSKGGLLYHFPSKDALVLGLVCWALDAFERRIAEALALESGPGAFARAWLAASRSEPEEETALAAALVAVIAQRPELLDPLRERYAAWGERFAADGVDPVEAAIVRLAVDGWWFARISGLPLGSLPTDAIWARLRTIAGAP